MKTTYLVLPDGRETVAHYFPPATDGGSFVEILIPAKKKQDADADTNFITDITDSVKYYYVIREEDDSYSCTCYKFTNYGGVCLHISTAMKAKRAE